MMPYDFFLSLDAVGYSHSKYLTAIIDLQLCLGCQRVCLCWGYPCRIYRLVVNFAITIILEIGPNHQSHKFF